ncbi:MAG: cell wall-active antibiotics response protein [Lachnospiraceae bacterium]|nr:cell wall-active antibiotics response protein [Lachnospiraceae bacterium]
MRNRMSNVVWGILLIAVGLGYAGNNLGFWDFSIFFKGWWTLFIIIPCLIDMIQHGVNGGNIIGLCIGGALFCSAQGFLDFGLVRRMLVPALLVLIGLSILLSNTRRGIRDQQGNKIPYEKDGAGLDVSAVFGDRKANYSGQIFEGSTVNAVFGAVELDLRTAIIEQDVRVDATVVFGGANILVPSNVIVKVMSTPILGGVSNKAMAPTEVPCHTLYLNATCVFGGVDIR